MPIECGCLVVVAENHCLRLYPLHIYSDCSFWIGYLLSLCSIQLSCIHMLGVSTHWESPDLLDRFLHTGVIVGLRVLLKKVAISIFVIRISDGFVCIILFLQHASSLGTRLLAATLVKMSWVFSGSWRLWVTQSRMEHTWFLSFSCSAPFWYQASIDFSARIFAVDQVLSSDVFILMWLLCCLGLIFSYLLHRWIFSLTCIKVDSLFYWHLVMLSMLLDDYILCLHCSGPFIHLEWALGPFRWVLFLL